MVINKQTNRLKNLFKLDLNLPKAGVKALPDELKRLDPNEDYRVGAVREPPVRVPRSAIDLNGHVNNTEYVRWGMDALRRTFKLKEKIRSVQATYLSEVFEGDEMDLLATSRANGQFGVLGRKSGTDSNVFLMEICC